jgi:carbamate kinase
MGRGILLALGGNAILPAGRGGSIQEQRAVTSLTMQAVAEALQPEDRLLISHGNGPVVGHILLRNEAAADRIPPMPLDICDADSQGGIGYMIVQCLENALRRAGHTQPVAALVTRVRVDEADPASKHPDKPVGPFYTEEEARDLATRRGWVVREDSGRGWRRVVPSPRPMEILELEAIRTLLEAGHVVVAAGGGGIPVARDADGTYHGIEAVVDKDRSSAVLAVALGLDLLVMVTAVDRVAIRFGRPDQQDLDRLSVSEARRYLEEGEFGVGSMKPKIESVLEFLSRGGKEALVTSPGGLQAALTASAGTRILPDSTPAANP